jgi:hypothetical protein
MTKSPLALRLDEIQSGLDKLLKPLGFKKGGRSFNRSFEPGVVQVVWLWMAPSPIGDRGPMSPEFTAALESHYGNFTVEIGIFVEEVYRLSATVPVKIPKIISAPSACIRKQLRPLANGWSLQDSASAILTRAKTQ